MTLYGAVKYKVLRVLYVVIAIQKWYPGKQKVRSDPINSFGLTS